MGGEYTDRANLHRRRFYYTLLLPLRLSVSEDIPALGTDHAWEESARVEPTDNAPGSLELTCSVCGAVRREVLPPLAAPGSMAEMLASISTVLSAILGWVGIVSEKVSTNPVLLIVVLLSFLGTGVLLFKRLLGMR